MDMQQPLQQGAPAPGGAPQDQDDGSSVTITKQPDGTFTVGDQPAKDIEEALNMAREQLTGEGGMTPEKAFGEGFRGEQPGAGY